MKLQRRASILLVLVLVSLAAGAAPVAAASPTASSVLTSVSTHVLADGTRVVLSKVTVDTANGDMYPQSAGQWSAGCNMTGYSAYGRIWTYTVTQEFWSNGSYITYFPPPAKSGTGWLGWVLTSSPEPTHWWISYPYTAAARGSYTFTWFDISGHSLGSTTGWVEVDVNFAGTWSCQGA